MAPPSVSGLSFLAATGRNDFVNATFDDDPTTGIVTLAFGDNGATDFAGTSCVEARANDIDTETYYSGYFPLASPVDVTGKIIILHVFGSRINGDGSLPDGLVAYAISGTGLTDFVGYSFGPMDDFGQWQAIAFSVDATPFRTGGTFDPTDVQKIGVAARASNGRMWVTISQAQICTEITYSGGEVADPASLSDMYDRMIDPANANYSLIFESQASGFVFRFPFVLNTDYFRSSIEVWRFPSRDKERYPTDQYSLTFSGADIEADLCLISADELEVTIDTGTTLKNTTIAGAGTTAITGGSVSGTHANRGVTTVSGGSVSDLTFVGTGNVDLVGAITVGAIFENVPTVLLDAGAALEAVFRDSLTGDGIQIEAAPGDYSALDIRFTNNVGTDITIDPPSAGTYNLSGISVSTGYALKIHNASVTNAITVQIPGGITTNTTTAGGTITVESAPTTVTVQAQVSLVGAQIRIYDRDNTPAGSEGTEIAGIASNPSSTFAFSTDAANDVSVQIFLAGYEEFLQLYTVPNSNGVFDALLVVDRNA